VYILGINDGKKCWSFNAGTPIGSSPAVIKDKFYILQSFHSAYTINSEYGFFEIYDINEYLNMIKYFIKVCETNVYNIDDIRYYSKIFSSYTHIDYDKWYDKPDTLFLKEIKIIKF